MAEVLTQAQIDEMLSNVTKGIADTSPNTISNKNTKVKEYDFRAPKKFTKEQIKNLDAIFESYSRLLSSYFTGKLRLYSRVSLINIEEQKYNEFNNALPDYVIMGMVDFGVKQDDIDETTIIIQLSNNVTYTMIDRLLGGRGEFKDTGRDFTEIEINIMRNILTNLTELLVEPWSSHVDIAPQLQRIETNSRVAQSFGFDETVIIVMLEVEIQNAKSLITFCIPALNLDAIMHKVSTQNTRAFKKLDIVKEQEKKEDILMGLKETELEIQAVLGEVSLDMHEVLTLRVNDIIPLNKSIDSNVNIRIGEKNWFDGKLGTLNNKKAVRINKVLEN